MCIAFLVTKVVLRNGVVPDRLGLMIMCLGSRNVVRLIC